MLEQLRYVRLPTAALAKASDFATGMIGLELTEKGEDFARFRSDDKAYALEYDASGRTSDPVVGLEVRSERQLAEAAQRLAAMGLTVEEVPAELGMHRRFKAGIAFADFSGNRFEIVIRHQDKAPRYFPSRDAGILGLSDTALRSTDIDRDCAIWTEIFGAEIRDFVGRSIYLGFDDRHHRLSLHPSGRGGLLQISFEVEDLNNIMQNYYFLTNHQVRILHGPGKLPCSGEVFVTFEGPELVAFRYGLGMQTVQRGTRPRQFSDAPESYCNWGSQSLIPELSGGAM
ncbi:VOC family protein [Bradyrhizobium manausense]|jgi:2,3-dihydroxy-p-cumate/2,3-dihydroxybenzoate 3,4-dioxygenase|uniref:VOC family protein n=1 Tax=Bradyrhizobium manausense TaxID=989370 RepID=UPI001BA68C2D|nr:VOC family protein [Bradyrhizobium manausense]MBR1087708.1 VOC family protein [Bradyrhizobium manausense]